MPKEDNYYVFSPPFSKSEHFVKVTGLEKSQSDGKVYVHYKHILNNDMENNYEQQHFEQGSTLLDEEKVSNIVENIKNEIGDLEQKKEEFKKVLNKIREDRKNSHDQRNTTTNGTVEKKGSYEKKEIEKVRS